MITKDVLKKDLDTMLDVAAFIAKFTPTNIDDMSIAALRYAIDNTEILDKLYEIVQSQNPPQS